MQETIEMPKSVEDIRFESLDALAKGKGFNIPENEIQNWRNFVSRKMHKQTDKRFRVTMDLTGKPIVGRVK
ncbi:MAG: hypothetical protein JWR05_3531 [Mucilaginibacter sp.]|nr:hypothetical protein [Mucilaginibacter sp.]